MIDFTLIIDSLPALLRGAQLSLVIASCSAIIGIIGGTLLALVQLGAPKMIRWIATGYINITRGTPMLVQISVFYFVLPEFGLKLPALWAAIIAIGSNSACYVSQIIKSGILGVGQGQIEAGRVLGLSHIQIIRYIVLPQAIRMVMPSLGNEFITLIKDSSLASVIGVTELAKTASLIRSRTYDAISIYLAIAVLYLIMTALCAIAIHWLEQRMNRHAQH